MNTEPGGDRSMGRGAAWKRFSPISARDPHRQIGFGRASHTFCLYKMGSLAPRSMLQHMSVHSDWIQPVRHHEVPSYFINVGCQGAVRAFLDLSLGRHLEVFLSGWHTINWSNCKVMMHCFTLLCLPQEPSPPTCITLRNACSPMAICHCT